MLNGFSIIVLLLAFSSCQKNPPVPDVQPIFRDKKRPPYNHVIMSKIKRREHNDDYQEVNPNFANEYQDAQREFSQTKPEEIMIIQQESNDDALTIQKIRDDAIALQDISLKEQVINEAQKIDEDEIPTQEEEIDEIEIPTQDEEVDEIPSQEEEVDSNLIKPIGGVYEIQAGSYTNKLGAQNVIQKLEKHSIKNIRLETIQDMYLIRISGDKPLNTREEASKLLQSIIDKTQHYDIMVVKM